MRTKVVLASASRIRLALLDRAGVAVNSDPAALDESAIKTMLRQAGTGTEAAARHLARAKAAAVAPRHPGALVIGADQILDLDGVWFDKPETLARADAQLRDLRGRTHRLVSAVSVLCDGVCLWSEVDTAALTMRDFSEEFLENYLADAGDAVLSSVGAYEYEGVGAQLFDRVEGDFFTILGLPLVPLLGFLRSQGALAT